MTPTRVCLTSAQTGWAWRALSVAAAVMGPSSGAAPATAQWRSTPCVHVMLASTWLSRRSATRLCTKPFVPSIANRPGIEIGSWALPLRYTPALSSYHVMPCSLGCGAGCDSLVSHMQMQQGQIVKPPLTIMAGACTKDLCPSTVMPRTRLSLSAWSLVLLKCCVQ